jgi:hypothetical protein
MCPCDLSRHILCGYHAREIERLYDELRDLEPREQALSVADYNRLRHVRGALLAEGLRAEVVIHAIKTREWEERSAA